MSEFHAELYAARPDWSQGLLVLPDLVAIDCRLWTSSTRGYWSMTSQVAVGIDHEIVHLAVGPQQMLTTLDPLSRAVQAQAKRLLEYYVEPWPNKPPPAAAA